MRALPIMARAKAGDVSLPLVLPSGLHGSSAYLKEFRYALTVAVSEAVSLIIASARQNFVS